MKRFFTICLLSLLSFSPVFGLCCGNDEDKAEVPGGSIQSTKSSTAILLIAVTGVVTVGVVLSRVAFSKKKSLKS